MSNSSHHIMPDEIGSDCFDGRVRANQQRLAQNLKPAYDFVVCGSGSSGSVVARRLAENPNVSVLLLEAGGSDEDVAVTDATRWLANLGSQRDWGFRTRPNPHLNGRSLLWSMGKVLGGGSSVNAMIWARGHKNDWDYFASETGDAAWGYEEVLKIYRRIEKWQGEPDPARRGAGGLVFVQPAPDPNPIAPATLEGARSISIPTFADQNGIMMECEGGAALCNVRVRDGKRLSLFRTPDLQSCQAEFPLPSPDLTGYHPPAASWTLGAGVVRTGSRGHLHLTGPNPSDPLDIDTNLLSDPADFKAALAVVQSCREIGNSAALRPFTKREVAPGNLCKCGMENFVRNAVIPYWHQTCTAKMGRDAMSVVDGNLKAYGLSRLRVADGSIMPRVTQATSWHFASLLANALPS